MTIQSLYFGKDDAETDFKGSGLLQGSFLKTTIYEDIKSRKKSLVIGRKGSGKSALCLMLKKELSLEEKTYVCLVTPDAISADEIRQFQMSGVNEQQSKKLIWKYIFLVQICKFLLEVARNHNDWESSSDNSDWSVENDLSHTLNKIRSFLVENNEVDDLNFQEKFWSIINRIQTKITLKAFDQSAEIETNHETNEGKNFDYKLDFLEKYLEKLLKFFQKYKFYILVDKVDEIWDNDTSSDKTVIGLLMASKQINEIYDNAFCTVFLRADIYEQLQFFDKDKLRGDEVSVTWTSEKLPEIILERAKASTKNRDLTSDSFWSEYFPQQINTETTSDFILSYTLMRPREIIQLCNLCVDTARREGSITVECKHITQAIDSYSNWKLNDLIGEYIINYPFLNDLLILFSNTSYVVPRQCFEIVFERVIPALEERYSNYKNYLNIDTVLNILYGIGFLGVERVDKSVFYYQNAKTVEETDKVFIVHPAFRNALKCTSSIDIEGYSATDGIGNFKRYFSEIQRGRSATRVTGEILRSQPDRDGGISYLRKMLDAFRTIVIKEEIPVEVKNEISRNLSVMIKQIDEFTENSDYPDMQGEIIRINIITYLSKLKEKLSATGFVSEKSSMSRELDKLLTT
ncbi:MAG: ATP-binding protein [Cyanomargarita calcarea GSE-NOS-MK-12-04C]|jgi:energy-coupling factor transporter ATP-binding protein EcfA2|uniref:ATP-binding protein n=1 Tax=Cyanomargarita calcarea GSE-NOS-MK-12-04C TaxID=2839659 RepID=A0A951QPU0_9CYAN|nr:ATP-binding protein [Cyanomargarita calcarea GSE-NOS-MK-12-04C]